MTQQTTSVGILDDYISLRDIQMLIHQYENPDMTEVLDDITDFRYYKERADYTIRQAINEMDYCKLQAEAVNRRERDKVLSQRLLSRGRARLISSIDSDYYTDILEPNYTYWSSYYGD